MAEKYHEKLKTLGLDNRVDWYIKNEYATAQMSTRLL